MSVARTYPLRIAAAAAKVSEKTLRRWQDNHIIVLRGNDLTTSGTGNPCGWSRNRILQAAVTEPLLKNGVSLSTAAKAAFKVSDEGQTGRAPGELFKHGKTMLFLDPDGPKVKNILFDATLADVSNRGVCIFIDINRIVDSVDTTLKETM
jgi:hypothetical protein